MEIDKLLEKLNNKFGSEWSLVCRFHYHVESKINWSELKQRYGDKIINGNNFEDIIEYLKCSDAIITDISSCLFDFALMNRPVFLFFPDLDNYKNNERGLYIEIENLPFKCSEDFNGLLKNIEEFNSLEYSKKVKKFIKELGYLNEKETAEKIAKFILNDGVENE